MNALMQVVNEGVASFERATREDGSTYVRKTADAPQWVDDMVYAAHDDGDMLPDDTRYFMIEAALDALAEADDDATADDLSDQRDALPDPFDAGYSTVARWLSESYTGVRMDYCDEAAREWGSDLRDTTFTRLARGMAWEQADVFDSVLASILREAESR